MSRWVEWRPGWVETGSSVVITTANVEAPRDRAYRLDFCEIEIVANGPMLCNIRLYGPISSTSPIAISGAFAVGVIPVRRTLRTPKGTDWFEKGVETRALVAVDALCQTPQLSHRAMVIFKAHLTLSPEEIPDVCPKLIHPTYPGDGNGFALV